MVSCRKSLSNLVKERRQIISVVAVLATGRRLQCIWPFLRHSVCRGRQLDRSAARRRRRPACNHEFDVVEGPRRASVEQLAHAVLSPVAVFRQDRCQPKNKTMALRREHLPTVCGHLGQSTQWLSNYNMTIPLELSGWGKKASPFCDGYVFMFAAWLCIKWLERAVCTNAQAGEKESASRTS